MLRAVNQYKDHSHQLVIRLEVTPLYSVISHLATVGAWTDWEGRFLGQGEVMDCITVMQWVNMYFYLSILVFFTIKLSLSGTPWYQVSA